MLHVVKEAKAKQLRPLEQSLGERLLEVAT